MASSAGSGTSKPGAPESTRPDSRARAPTSARDHEGHRGRSREPGVQGGPLSVLCAPARASARLPRRAAGWTGRLAHYALRGRGDGPQGGTPGQGQVEGADSGPGGAAALGSRHVQAADAQQSHAGSWSTRYSPPPTATRGSFRTRTGWISPARRTNISPSDSGSITAWARRSPAWKGRSRSPLSCGGLRDSGSPSRRRRCAGGAAWSCAASRRCR